MVRQNQMRAAADKEPAVHIDACLHQLVNLLEQRRRIDHDTVADHADHAWMEHAGGDEPENELPPVHVDGVPGVVTTLIASHDVEVGRQQVDDLALPFVTPLRAQHGEIHKRIDCIRLSRHFPEVSCARSRAWRPMSQ